MDQILSVLAIAGVLLLVFVYGAFRSGAYTSDPYDSLGLGGPRPGIAANLGFAAAGLAVAAPFLYFLS